MKAWLQCFLGVPLVLGVLALVMWIGSIVGQWLWARAWWLVLVLAWAVVSAIAVNMPEPRHRASRKCTP